MPGSGYFYANAAYVKTKTYCLNGSVLGYLSLVICFALRFAFARDLGCGGANFGQRAGFRCFNWGPCNDTKVVKILNLGE